MGYGQFRTNVMTRRGQSSRWAPRALVKAYTKRRRRHEGRQAVRAERSQ